ncbi:MAG: hypothetical protein MJ252_09520 [archaeon]|nr:hypothetical protein [archaeon]
MSFPGNQMNEKPMGNEGGNLQGEGKKKNRTLQFYKFLFYSIKVEIKVHEFIKMVRMANIGEIVLWILSFILYFASKKFPNVNVEGERINFTNYLIWPQIIHVARAITGFFIYYTFPKSYMPIETIKKVDENKLENIFFNDLVRETLNETVIKPIQGKKVALLFYVGFTFFNMLIDVISFLVFIANLHKATSGIKVVLMAYVYIDIIYLILDFKYILWLRTLKYVFPQKYMDPMSDAFYGAVSRLKDRFKIGKAKTDLRNEQKERVVEVKDMIKSDQPQSNFQFDSQSPYQSNIPHNPDDERIDI